jgi:septal ring factor EnvC (AmiA/AmiB activator)
MRCEAEPALTAAFSAATPGLWQIISQLLNKRRAKMRKFFIPIVAAVSAFAVAAPATAQWAPPVYHYQPYNYGQAFSYHAFARSMQVRVQRIRTDIRAMQARRILSWREARSLERQAANLQFRIYRASRNGIQPAEARRLENQIRNLEFRVQREATDRNNQPNRRRY